MRRKSAFLILLLTVVFVAGCTNANEKFIQGTWYMRSEHLDQATGETYLEVEWTFNSGAFEYRACCFNVDQHLTGRYRILDNKDDILTIELFNIKGSGSIGPAELRLVINRDEDTLVIQGGQPYTRLLSGVTSR